MADVQPHPGFDGEIDPTPAVEVEPARGLAAPGTKFLVRYITVGGTRVRVVVGATSPNSSQMWNR